MSATGQKTREQLLLELDELRARLQEAEETLEAIRSGAVDALVVATAPGEEQLFTLEGADRVYRIFLESISEGAITLANDGLIVYANEAASGLLHAGEEGLVGAHLRDRIPVGARGSFDALLERAQQGAVHAEIRVLGGSGSHPVYLSLRPFEDRGDCLMTAVLTDLTDQKATEAALESERLARSIFEQAGEPIILCDKDGIVIRASRAAVKLVGREPVLQDFDKVLRLRTEDGRDDFSLKEQGHENLRGKEVRLERSDGASFDLILNASTLETVEQGIIGTVVTLTDITRIKEAEEVRETLLHDFERANKELETIESLSHAGLQLTTVEQLAHSIVSQVATAMDADQVVLLLAEDGEPRLTAAVPPIRDGRGRVEVGGGFIGTILKMGRSLFVEDAAASRAVTQSDWARRYTSLLGSPLLDGTRVMGALCVGWTDRHVADPGQQRLLEIIAARAATGISARMLADQRDEERYTAQALATELSEVNARLLSRQRVLEVLQELTTVANSSLSLVEIAERVLELAYQRLELSSGLIYAVERSAGELEALALIGFPEDAAAEMQTVPIDDESTMGALVHHSLPIVTHESGPLPVASAKRLRSTVGSAPSRWVALPVKKGERILGVLGLTFLGERSFEEEELSLYQSIAELLGAAFDNARLYQEQRRTAMAEERSRLARDLHDSITQALFAAALKAEALLQYDGLPKASHEAAEEVRRLARGALAQMRTLLFELRSESAENVPIELLLRNAVEATEGRANVVVNLSLSGDREPPRQLHTALYRVTQEALNNIARHSGARRASVELQVEASRVRLLIRDDGRGFRPAEVPPEHLGLRSMQERAAEAGADLRLVSEPGEGTLVILDWRDEQQEAEDDD